MEKENKLLLGKLLGEVYRLQKKANIPVGSSVGQIYGLLHGFEHAIDHELEMMGDVSQAQFEAVGNILDKIYVDEERMKAFKGFYELETKFSAVGIDRGQANKILRYYYAEGRFEDLIDKMDTSDSPTESRTFKLSEWDL
jgi:hypothetical protein